MTTRPTLFVHIGNGKTGSTSIQQTLETNREALAAQGLSYLGWMLENCETPTRQSWQHPDGALRLLHQMDDEEAADQIFDVLSAELDRCAKTGIRTAIWSNEALFARREGASRALLRLRERGHPVTALVYLRRHDKWAKSAYAQWGIRHKSYDGPVMPFADWIAARPPGFGGNLEFWHSRFGKDLKVRNFDAVGDVSTDFLNHVGAQDITPIRAYETPSPTTLAAWAVHNSQSSAHVQPQEFARILNAAGVAQNGTQNAPALADLSPTPEQMAQLLADCQDDIARVNAVLADNDQPVFGTDNPAPGADAPTEWEMMQFMMKMIFSLQDQVADLKTRLNKRNL